MAGLGQTAEALTKTCRLEIHAVHRAGGLLLVREPGAQVVFALPAPARRGDRRCMLLPSKAAFARLGLICSVLCSVLSAHRMLVPGKAACTKAATDLAKGCAYPVNSAAC
eukprot:scaffold18381_cov79-Phaeocystis_antarctica.AAC.10